MKTVNRFDSIWDALEDDPIRAQNLRLRSELLMRITEKLKATKMKQKDIARILEITQPRVSALMHGKIERFRLDSLVDIAHRLGLAVTLRVAA